MWCYKLVKHSPSNIIAGKTHAHLNCTDSQKAKPSEIHELSFTTIPSSKSVNNNILALKNNLRCFSKVFGLRNTFKKSFPISICMSTGLPLWAYIVRRAPPVKSICTLSIALRKQQFFKKITWNSGDQKPVQCTCSRLWIFRPEWHNARDQDFEFRASIWCHVIYAPALMDSSNLDII